MRSAYRIALVSVVVALPLLMAPTGGFPSRPKFQQVTVSGADAVRINNITPGIWLNETDQGVDEKKWRADVAGKAFRVLVCPDDETGCVVGLSIVRGTGATVGAINLTGASVQENGVRVATLAPQAVGGNVGALVSTQFKGGNTDRSNTATLAADVTLAGLAIPAAGTYLIDSQLCFVGPVSGAGGIKFRYEFSGSVSGGVGLYTGAANAVPVASGGFLALDANQISFATITTATASDCIRFSHTAITTGAGTMDLQWAQNASNANATRLSAGSAMWIYRIG